MAEPLIISASTAPTGTSTESPPVFGSTPSLGIVSRITPSFADVLLPELVVAPEVVVFAAPVLAAVVVAVVASVVSVVLVVLVVAPVVVSVVVPVVPVVPLVRVMPVVVVPVVVLVVLVVVVVVPVVPVVLVPVVCPHAPRMSP
jgi:hypothetical protein